MKVARKMLYSVEARAWPLADRAPLPSCFHASIKWLHYVWTVAFFLVAWGPLSTALAQVPRWPDPVAGHVLPYETSGLTHGPLLGGVTSESVRIWIKTRLKL